VTILKLSTTLNDGLFLTLAWTGCCRKVSLRILFGGPDSVAWQTDVREG